MKYQIIKNNITEKFHVRKKGSWWWPFWTYVTGGYTDSLLNFNTCDEALKYIVDTLKVRKHIKEFQREQIIDTIEE